tara:strand:+ start:39 stop:524 length:486 start_codon:yes stop_codon:yes gene_type:complete
MKLFKTLLTILVISLLSSPSWSATIDDLVQREGIYYQKFNDVPFTGKVTGNPQATFKNGKEEGAFISYWMDGQLSFKGNYKNGKEEGAFISYWLNGQLQYKRNFKSGKAEGAWVEYWENGQLNYKGNYKNGKAEGAWVSYNKDGTVRDYTGTYKDGEKISD